MPTDLNRPGWIGVDLDGTLAYYDGWRGLYHIGPPIPAMVERVVKWHAEGKRVKIVTARLSSMQLPEANEHNDTNEMVVEIGLWCLKHLGFVLPVTNMKDFDMIELWDDRAVQVVPNTGRRVDGRE